MTALHTALTPAWWDLASCAGVDPEIFFPAKGEPYSAALAICQQCPVKAECLKDALNSFDVQSGIRGGKTPNQRRELAKDLPKACTWCGTRLSPDVDRKTKRHPECVREAKQEHSRRDTRLNTYRK